MWTRSFAILALSGGLLAQSPCDPEVEAKADRSDPSGYRVRVPGERCEGAYLQKVAGSFGGLWIASLTAASVAAGPWPDVVPVEWRAFGDGGVRLCVFPLRARTYYRADIQRPAGANSYLWKTDLIRNRISPPEAGFVASTSAMVDRRRQTVYLPVSTAKSPAGATGKFKLVVISPVELREVYLTVAENANRARPLRDHTALRYGSYPANQRIEIDLVLAKPELYVVEVSGERRDQGSLTTGPFLIHAGQ